VSSPSPGLDLDDFGAEIRQQLRRPGAGQDAAEIENPQSGQARIHGRLSLDSKLDGNAQPNGWLYQDVSDTNDNSINGINP
jgi:hypothetical protein